MLLINVGCILKNGCVVEFGFNVVVFGSGVIKILLVLVCY